MAEGKEAQSPEEEQRPNYELSPADADFLKMMLTLVDDMRLAGLRREANQLIGSIRAAGEIHYQKMKKPEDFPEQLTLKQELINQYGGGDQALIVAFVSAIEQTLKELQAAEIDFLTKAFTRKKLNHDLSALLTNPNRREKNEPFCLMILDVDGFKAINDNYGHPVGDKFLRFLADILSQGLRKGDKLYRYGGDEFAILLPQTDLERAKQLAKRLLDEVKNSKLPISEDGSSVSSSISIGIAHSTQLTGDSTADALIELADGVLIEVKKTGKGRAAVYEG